MVKPINLAVLISGRGSNLQSIIDACGHEDYPARISVVISNEPDVMGLSRAKDAGLPTEVIPHKSYPSRREFETALSETLAKHPVDLICLAGFMRVLTPDFVSKWEGKILNIHPSLLPAYPGLHVHERVLHSDDKESGCTVHFVTPGLDEGPTLVQKRVPVLQDDTPDTLAARVLEQEHLAYPEAIRLIALGKVKYTKDFVEIGDAGPYTPPAKVVPAAVEPAQPPALVAPPVQGQATAAPVPKPAPEPASAKHTPPIAPHKTPVNTTKETQTMSNHSPADNAPDQVTIRESEAMWHYFTKAAQVLVIGVAVVLLLMAATLL